MARKNLDLQNKRFGLLLAKSEPYCKNGHVCYICRCDWGGEKEVRAEALVHGKVKSCGCLLHKPTAQKHGMYQTRLYGCWKAMKARCMIKSNIAYDNYGGRGITVCDEWLDDFRAFESWALTNCYTDELTLDRIDVNGNYEPANCRWATTLEQANNTRRNVRVVFNGESFTIAEWARKSNIDESALRGRLSRGWSIEKALSTPVDLRFGKKTRRKNASEIF